MNKTIICDDVEPIFFAVDFRSYFQAEEFREQFAAGYCKSFGHVDQWQYDFSHESSGVSAGCVEGSVLADLPICRLHLNSRTELHRFESSALSDWIE